MEKPELREKVEGKYRRFAGRGKNSIIEESYKILWRGRDCRISAGARLKSTKRTLLFIDVLVSICSSESKVCLSSLERKLKFLKELKARGYSIYCQEYGSISCELTLSPKKLFAELNTIESMIKKILRQ
ncbi:MAG: hypothetical protein ACUVTL_03475 [Thermoproteota archaeon]